MGRAACATAARPAASTDSSNSLGPVRPRRRRDSADGPAPWPPHNPVFGVDDDGFGSRRALIDGRDGHGNISGRSTPVTVSGSTAFDPGSGVDHSVGGLRLHEAERGRGRHHRVRRHPALSNSFCVLCCSALATTSHQQHLQVAPVPRKLTAVPGRTVSSSNTVAPDPRRHAYVSQDATACSSGQSWMTCLRMWRLPRGRCRRSRSAFDAHPDSRDRTSPAAPVRPPQRREDRREHPRP